MIIAKLNLIPLFDSQSSMDFEKIITFPSHQVGIVINASHVTPSLSNNTVKNYQIITINVSRTKPTFIHLVIIQFTCYILPTSSITYCVYPTKVHGLLVFKKNNYFSAALGYIRVIGVF